MIPELFLSCALSAAPVSFTHGVNHSGAVLAANGVSFSKLLRTNGRKMLFVGGHPEVVGIFRQHGLHAFGAMTEDGPGATPWHVVADAGLLAFQNASFHSVYWMAEKRGFQDMGFKELLDVIRLIEPCGTLLFDDNVWMQWPMWLKGRGWIRAPIKFLGFSVWERRNQYDHNYRGRQELRRAA